MGAFWVIGGRYASTRFDKLADGAEEERYGPFESYKAAKQEWERLSWKTVDNCHFRYRIVEDQNVE